MYPRTLPTEVPKTVEDRTFLYFSRQTHLDFYPPSRSAGITADDTLDRQIRQDKRPGYKFISVRPVLWEAVLPAERSDAYGA